MKADKRAVIYGMAIGDGYVQVRNRRNGNSIYQAREMKVVHAASQRAYIEHKASRLGWALGGRQIKVHDGLTELKATGKSYPHCRFTVSHPYFGQVHRVLYPDGKKTFTAQLLDYLNIESIALWYMDDGSARRNTNSKGFVTSVATDIATECTEPEADLLVEWFLDEHGVPFKKRFRKQTGRWSLQANTEGSRLFGDLVQPFIVPPMLYKLAHVADLRSHECGTPVGSCTECGKTIYENRRNGLCVACYSVQYRKR